MAPKKTPPASVTEPATITAFKGFDTNFRCRNFQYEKSIERTLRLGEAANHPAADASEKALPVAAAGVAA